MDAIAENPSSNRMPECPRSGSRFVVQAAARPAASAALRYAIGTMQQRDHVEIGLPPGTFVRAVGAKSASKFLIFPASIDIDWMAPIAVATREEPGEGKKNRA